MPCSQRAVLPGISLSSSQKNTKETFTFTLPIYTLVRGKGALLIILLVWQAYMGTVLGKQGHGVPCPQDTTWNSFERVCWAHYEQTCYWWKSLGFWGFAIGQTECLGKVLDERSSPLIGHLILGEHLPLPVLGFLTHKMEINNLEVPSGFEALNPCQPFLNSWTVRMLIWELLLWNLELLIHFLSMLQLEKCTMYLRAHAQHPKGENRGKGLWCDHPRREGGGAGGAFSFSLSFYLSLSSSLQQAHMLTNNLFKSAFV